MLGLTLKYLEVSGNGNPELAALVMAARRAKSLNTNLRLSTLEALFWLRCNPLALKTGHNPFFFGKKTGCPETARFFLVKKRAVQRHPVFFWYKNGLSGDSPFCFGKKTGCVAGDGQPVFLPKKNGLLTLF